MLYKIGDKVRYVGNLYDLIKGIEVTISSINALILEGMAYYECSFTYKGLPLMLSFHEDALEPLIDQNEVI